MIERLSLNSLKFFYYVALYDSVTIAAEKLFVTQGAVSKQLKNLEEVLGRRLFIRDGKKLQLTGDGLTLFDCCEQVFPQIDQCLVQMAKEKKNEKKTLILSCEPTIAMKWLIPRLVQFKLRYHAWFGVISKRIAINLKIVRISHIRNSVVKTHHHVTAPSA